jgi:hypothetical protein
MAKSKNSGTHARASGAGASGQSKRPRHIGNASAAGHSSRQQRSADTTASRHKRQHGGAPAAEDEPTSRRTPSEYDPDAGTVESGGGRERRDVSIDEETGILSRRPGDPGDASFGDDDEGPEDPAR